MLFEHPLIAAVGFVLFFIFMRRKGESTFFGYSSIEVFRSKPSMLLKILSVLPRVFFYAIIAMFFLALSGPKIEKGEYFQRLASKDIIFIIDLSYSMQGNFGGDDFIHSPPPQRGSKLGDQASPYARRKLNVAKRFAADFVESRREDRFGIIVFGDKALGMWPLTSDKDVIIGKLAKLGDTDDGGSTGYLGGTDMEKALEVTLGYLDKDQTAKNPILIFLSDGRGALSAKKMDSIVYRLTRKRAHFYWISLDFENLEDSPVTILVRRLDNGKKFLATDEEALRIIREDINQIEKHGYKSERIGEQIDLLSYICVFGSFLIVAYVIIRGYEL